MTNLEKFKEVFGDTGNDVKAAPSWLAKKYNGPVKKTEMDKFVDWLKTLPLIKYDLKDNGTVVYISDFNNNPIIRVSYFNSVAGNTYAYVRYEGLCGDMLVTKIKEIISKAACKCDPFANTFDDIFRNK